MSDNKTSKIPTNPANIGLLFLPIFKAMGPAKKDIQAIGPVIEVEKAVKDTAQKIKTSLESSGFAPSPIAISSPSSIISSLLLKNKTNIVAIILTIRTRGMSSNFVKDKEPLSHLITSCNSYLATFNNKNEVPALMTAWKPIPNIISLAAEKPSFLASKNNIKDDVSPQVIEIIPVVKLFVFNTNMQKTAAIDEELVTPIISGLARGFLNIVWKINPANPKDQPAIIPANNFGNLISIIEKLAPGTVSLFKTLIKVEKE